MTHTTTHTTATVETYQQKTLHFDTDEKEPKCAKTWKHRCDLAMQDHPTVWLKSVALFVVRDTYRQLPLYYLQSFCTSCTSVTACPSSVTNRTLHCNSRMSSAWFLGVVSRFASTPPSAIASQHTRADNELLDLTKLGIRIATHLLYSSGGGPLCFLLLH